MRRSAFQNSQAGTSLVELLVGVAILGIIGTFAANFFTRLSSSDVEASARASAISQLAAVANTIDRDLKFRVKPAPPTTLPPLCPGGTCTNFQYDRLIKLNAAGAGEVNNQVTVRTSCVAIPNRIRTRLPTTNLGAGTINSIAPVIAGVSTSAGGRCLKAINCPANQYPRIEFVRNPVAGGANPLYPPTLPDLKDEVGVAKNVVAAAACVESEATSDKVTVEALILTGDKSFRIEKKEMIFPRQNVANIQMLPNCDPGVVNCF